MKVNFYFVISLVVLFGCTGVPIRADKEAQSAIGAITGAVSGKALSVKYCPATGKRYSPRIETCPVHGVELKNVDD